MLGALGKTRNLVQRNATRLRDEAHTHTNTHKYTDGHTKHSQFTHATLLLTRSFPLLLLFFHLPSLPLRIPDSPAMPSLRCNKSSDSRSLWRSRRAEWLGERQFFTHGRPGKYSNYVYLITDRRVRRGQASRARLESKGVDLALFTDSGLSQHTLRFSFFRSEVDTPTMLFAI